MGNFIKITLLAFFFSIVNVMAKQASPCPDVLQNDFVANNRDNQNQTGIYLENSFQEKNSEKREVSSSGGKCGDTISYGLKKISSIFDKIKRPLKKNIQKKHEKSWESLSEKEKKEKILEEVAIILGEDMNLYAWSSSYFSNLKIKSRVNLLRLRKITDGENMFSDKSGWLRQGVYASVNINNSKEYGFGNPHLLNIRLKAGERFLDLADENILNKIGERFKENNFLVNGKKASEAKVEDYVDEIYYQKLNPDLAIKFMGSYGRQDHFEWLVLKNRKKKSISARNFGNGSYSTSEMNHFFADLSLMKNEDYRFSSEHRMHMGNTIKFLEKNLSKMENKWMKENLSRLTLNDLEWTPFGKCIMKTEKGLEILAPDECEYSSKKEKRLVPNSRDGKKYLSTGEGTFIRFFNDEDFKNKRYNP